MGLNFDDLSEEEKETLFHALMGAECDCASEAGVPDNEDVLVSLLNSANVYKELREKIFPDYQGDEYDFKDIGFE